MIEEALVKLGWDTSPGVGVAAAERAGIAALEESGQPDQDTPERIASAFA